MAQHEDEGMFELPFAAASTPTNAGTIHSRETDRGTLYDSDPASSNVAADISNSQPIVLPHPDSVFDIQSNPRFHNSRSLSLIRVRSGPAAALPILPRIPNL